MRPEPPMPTAGRPAETGAALMTVLLLIAILSVVAAVALERLTIASRMTRNIVSADQGRAYLLTAERMAGTRIADLLALRPDRTTLEGGWLGREQIIAVPGGTVAARIIDKGNCFNLNSLVRAATGGTGQGDETFTARPEGIAQFAGLMRLLGVDTSLALQVATSAADWIDSDSVPGNGGAEDDYYSGFDPSYRTANTLMADPSELLMVNAVTPDVYQRIRPWICTLPDAEMSPINVNTLLPGQAVLLAMLAPDALGLDQARQVLAQRPAAGYGSLLAFWALPAMVRAKAGMPDVAQTQVQQKSRWFEVALRADLGGDEVEEMVLFDAKDGQARLTRRKWGEGDG